MNGQTGWRILAEQKYCDVGDRVQLEIGEARVMVTSFILNGKDTRWLDRALRVTERIYGNGAGERVKGYMRKLWKGELA